MAKWIMKPLGAKNNLPPKNKSHKIVWIFHCNDMSDMASQITAARLFVQLLVGGNLIENIKGPLKQKAFPCHNVIMLWSTVLIYVE